MTFLHTALDGLRARLAAGTGVLHLSQDIDPRALTEELAAHYGVPHTLVGDGVTEPERSEARGAGLLDLLEGRGETIVAWAHADRWIGAGTAVDARGDVVPVVLVAPRRVPAPPEVPAGRDADWVGRLIGLTGWALPPRRPDVDWARVEARVGRRPPGDYRRMVETFGNGAFDGFLHLHQEPWTDLAEDGLLVWASTEHENLYCWRTDDGDPDRWPVTVRTFDGEDVPFDCAAAEFVCRALAEPALPFSLARFFDTHWFERFPDDV